MRLEFEIVHVCFVEVDDFALGVLEAARRVTSFLAS